MVCTAREYPTVSIDSNDPAGIGRMSNSRRNTRNARSGGRGGRSVDGLGVDEADYKEKQKSDEEGHWARAVNAGSVVRASMRGSIPPEGKCAFDFIHA